MAFTSYIFVAHKRASLRVVFFPVAIASPNSNYDNNYCPMVNITGLIGLIRLIG